MSDRDIRIMTVARCKYKQGTHIPKHDHPFHHLIYVTGGTAHMTIESINYTGREDDLFIMPPGTEHEFVSDRTYPLHTIEVKCYLQGERLGQWLRQLPLFVRGLDGEVRAKLEYLLREARYKLPFHQEMMRDGLHQCLLHLVRGQGIEAIFGSSTKSVRMMECIPLIESSTETTDCNDRMIDQAVEYIKDNYHNKITLHGLAKQFAICEEHLCRLFRKKIGISPIQYANRLRIDKAKELLVHSEMSIGEISERTGFQSLHHMSHYFSGKVHLSPIEYRQMHADSIYFHMEDEVN